MAVKKPSVAKQAPVKPAIRQVAGMVGAKAPVSASAVIDYKAEEMAQTPKKDLKVGDAIHTKEQRLQALGTITPTLDPLLNTILKNAESLYQPKKILSSGDWLMSHKEKP